jgi:hypothetical protein
VSSILSRRENGAHDSTESECEICVKLQKWPNETSEVLKTVYDESNMSKSNVFKWHESFRGGREDVNDVEKQRAPVTKRTDENVAKIRELVRSDRRLTCRVIDDELDMSKETVRNILVHDLSSEARASKLDGGTEGETSHLVHGLCGTTSRKIIFWIMLSQDETWCNKYDPEAKRQSMEWRLKNSSRPKSHGCLCRSSKQCLSAFSTSGVSFTSNFIFNGPHGVISQKK